MKIITKISVVSLLSSFVFSLVGSGIALAAGPSAVNLGSASNFAILAKSGISTTGTTFITGDIGVSPLAASSLTGFGLTIDSSNTFSTSAKVSGKIYAADYTAPTPATLTAAISDMQTAYTDAAGRTLPTATELGAGNIGGMTLAPGLYKWGTGVTIPADVTLAGGANDVWIFQIAQTLNLSAATHINLSGGAQAANIFWQVAGQTTLGTTSVFNGNILDQTAIVLNTGATLNGRAFAQTAVTLDSNAVTKAAASTTPNPTPTPSPTPSPSPTPTPTSYPAPTPTPSPTPAPMATPTPTPMPTLYLNTPFWPNGSLVKVDGNGTVYMVVNGVLKPFSSAAIFHARGLKFSDIQTVTASQIASSTMGTAVPYPDGSLIKGSNATVYIVVNGQKSGIPSLAIFKRLGLSFKKVIKLSDAEIATYTDTDIQQ